MAFALDISTFLGKVAKVIINIWFLIILIFIISNTAEASLGHHSRMTLLQYSFAFSARYFRNG
jgi:hypothetical protein